MARKLYDSFKMCVITTVDNEYSQLFDNSWSYGEIESWMLDTYGIHNDSVVTIEISSVKRYKYGKD